MLKRYTLRYCQVLILFLLSACHSSPSIEETNQAKIAALAKKANYQKVGQEIEYYRDKDALHRSLIMQGLEALQQNKFQDAHNRFEMALTIAPNSIMAKNGLARVATAKNNAQLFRDATQLAVDHKNEQALDLLEQILQSSPYDEPAQALRTQLLNAKNTNNNNQTTSLNKMLTMPVSLALKEVEISTVLELLSQTSELNFILDKDVNKNEKVTIFVKNEPIEDILKLLFKIHGFDYKVLNAKTLLIYANTADKNKQYEELMIRSFALNGADSKKTLDLISAMVNPKFIFLDEKSDRIVVRDNRNALDVVQRIVELNDAPAPEVMLDVEVLEMSSDKVENLGIRYPTSISTSINSLLPTGVENYSIQDLKKLNSDSFRFGVVDPLLIAKFSLQDGDAELLANPKIRVQNKERAKILLGDKVPVITTTTNQTSSAVSESISYLDVGLSLEATPEIHPNQEVSIDLNLEVSNIAKEIRSTTGLLTYQIGTRNIHTALRGKDGETLVLAGLIRNEERQSASRLPLFGKIPILGKFFSDESKTKNKTEIVLLITPYIVRSPHLPSAYLQAFHSGSLDKTSLDRLSLADGGEISLSSPKNDDTPSSESQNQVNEKTLIQSILPSSATNAIINATIAAMPTLGEELNIILIGDHLAQGKNLIRVTFPADTLALTQTVPLDTQLGTHVQTVGNQLYITLDNVPADSQGPLFGLRFKTLKPVKQAPIDIGLVSDFQTTTALSSKTLLIDIN